MLGGGQMCVRTLPFLETLPPFSLSCSLYIFLFDTLSVSHMDLVFLSLDYDSISLAILFSLSLLSSFSLSFCRQLLSDVRGRTSLGGGRMWQCQQHFPDSYLAYILKSPLPRHQPILSYFHPLHSFPLRQPSSW